MSKRKELSYYLSLEYPIIIRQVSFEDDKWFIAYCHELGRGACYGIGDNQVNAIKNFMREKEDFIRLLYENNRAIPEILPESNENLLSGTFSLRTTPQMHSQLSKMAKQSGVSTNQFCITLLAAGLRETQLNEEINKNLHQIQSMIKDHHSYMTDQLKYRFGDKSLYKVSGGDFSAIQFADKPESEYFTKKKAG
ncbi:MAG: toxin-antitoxin system HicB family antitoxin [Bacteroidales bacterium]|nr:toxin-antitoxin system HicB family antitoxin [Bacteroidales bacterium]